MSHTSKYKELLVFLSSPSDLETEREKCRGTIEEVNRIKAKSKGLLLQPVEAKDVLPGVGRPQASINNLLVNCRVVVLMMWKRWGTPTGQYTSGTEEEFEVIRKLRPPLGWRPRMLVYFKSAPQEETAREVLDFKHRNRLQIYYSNFTDAKDLADQLRTHLCLWLDVYSRQRLLALLSKTASGILVAVLVAFFLWTRFQVLVGRGSNSTRSATGTATTPTAVGKPPGGRVVVKSKIDNNQDGRENQFWQLLDTARIMKAAGQDGQAARDYSQAYARLPDRFRKLVDRRMISRAQSHLDRGEFNPAERDFEQAFQEVFEKREN